ncbi:MAG TPA: ferritin-like domain-containing protein [Polyangia bacterium]|nr:ferritin-like domain-containing protein [Polyangia bacterium]
MNLRERLNLRFIERVITSPEGRAHLLNQCADAEGNGENGFFEHILAHVDDPALQKMIGKHRDDELRHEQLFLGARDKTGIDVGPVPNHLKLIDRLDRAVGGFFAQPIRERRDIMQAYLMLQVIEERALTQFALLEVAFRDVDPATADIIAEIARDEDRHLKYCHAIARRYAPDERTERETVRELRQLEARAFAENGRANMQHLFDRGWVAVNPVEKLFWHAVNGLSARSEPPLTQFAYAEVA